MVAADGTQVDCDHCGGTGLEPVSLERKQRLGWSMQFTGATTHANGYAVSVRVMMFWSQRRSYSMLLTARRGGVGCKAWPAPSVN